MTGEGDASISDLYKKIDFLQFITQNPHGLPHVPGVPIDALRHFGELLSKDHFGPGLGHVCICFYSDIIIIILSSINQQDAINKEQREINSYIADVQGSSIQTTLCK